MDHHLDDQRGGMRFDPTINLGHVLTFVGFITTMAAGWVNLDKRLTVMETKQLQQVHIDLKQDERLRDELILIRASQERIENKLDTLTQDRRVVR